MNPQLDIFQTPPRSFHKTTDIGIQEHRNRERKANSQDQMILDYMRRSGKSQSPPEVHLKFSHLGWPLTSVRRSLSTLTERGLLVKTGEKADGGFGMTVNKWRVK